MLDKGNYFRMLQNGFENTELDLPALANVVSLNTVSTGLIFLQSVVRTESFIVSRLAAGLRVI